MKNHNYWLKKAKRGDSLAMIKLVFMYDTFDGVPIPKELRKTFYWYSESTDANKPEAQFKLALMYLKGEGTEKDKETAVYWLKEAVKNGYEEDRVFRKKNK